MQRTITGFRQDAESHWVAELDCGHGQHTRHNPPISDRPWVLRAQGRASRLGQALECKRCDRHEMPEGFAAYQRTKEFDETSIPAGLLKAHSTKRGVWGLIHVVSGALEYMVCEPGARQQTLNPASPGVIAPEELHQVAAISPVRFYVEFWRAETAT